MNNMLKIITTIFTIQLFFGGILYGKINLKELHKGKIKLSPKIYMNAYFLIKTKDQREGISNLTKDDFKKNDALIFYYHSLNYRQFWMPETHFPLDIIFTDGQFKILAIERDLPACSFREPYEKVPKTKTYIAQHVIELRSDSPFHEMFKVGNKLKVELIQQKELKTHSGK